MGVKGSLQPMKVRPSDLTQGIKRVKVSDDAGEKKGGKRRRKTKRAKKHKKTKKRGKYKKTRKRK